MKLPSGLSACDIIHRDTSSMVPATTIRCAINNSYLPPALIDALKSEKPFFPSNTLRVLIVQDKVRPPDLTVAFASSMEQVVKMDLTDPSTFIVHCKASVRNPLCLAFGTQASLLSAGSGPGQTMVEVTLPSTYRVASFKGLDVLVPLPPSMQIVDKGVHSNCRVRVGPCATFVLELIKNASPGDPVSVPLGRKAYPKYGAFFTTATAMYQSMDSLIAIDLRYDNYAKLDQARPFFLHRT